MRSIVTYYFTVLAVISTHHMIFPVNGQCTVPGCEMGDTSISIVTEIRQMFAEFHERLQAIDHRSQSGHEFLNASYQQIKNQQSIVMTSLQEIDRRSQEQIICIKQVQNIHELLNASNQQMTNQHTSVMRRLDEVMELLLDHDISTKNQLQNLCSPATEATLRPKTVTDLANDSTLLPSSNNWTIIMNRFDGSVNFNRTWIEYKNGFGNIGRGEFWMGNEKVHRLTTRSGLNYSLRVEVQLNATGGWFYADYASFSLDPENNNYTLRLSGYNGGNAGDSLTSTVMSSAGYLGGMSFSTWDSDNDKLHGDHCASHYAGGWWFNNCCYSCLMCRYSNSFFKWHSLDHLSSNGLLRAARMMIKIK